MLHYNNQIWINSLKSFDDDQTSCLLPYLAVHFCV